MPHRMPPIAVRLACAAAASAFLSARALAGSMLADFTYPYPVERYELTSQGQPLSMAYMDIAPAQASTANGKTIVLLLGKNFCVATWEGVIAAISPRRVCDVINPRAGPGWLDLRPRSNSI